MDSVQSAYNQILFRNSCDVFLGFGVLSSGNVFFQGINFLLRNGVLVNQIIFHNLFSCIEESPSIEKLG